MGRGNAIGIDFGTTNSAIAVSEGESVRLVRFAGGGETFRSVLYFPGERQAVCAGPMAIDRYLEEHAEGQAGGRLIQSVKSLLASRSFTATQIGGRRYTAEDLITILIRALRAGVAGEEAVAGRPVQFVGAETAEDEAMAVDRLRNAFTAAGFPRVAFEYEPVGAAYFYEQRLERDELILIGDFGGGTSDFSLMTVGPAARKKRGVRKILATGGLPLAGDAFDARIVRNVVSPLLGEGSEYRSMHKLLPVPASLYRKLERWHHLSFLRSPETMRTLRSIEVAALEPEKIGKLIAVVENDLGLELHRAVQRTKYQLSSANEGHFELHHPEVSIAQKVTRAEFELWIAEELGQIEQAVDRVAAQATGPIDRVFLTGGSSLIPAVRRIFETRFGAEKVLSGNEFTSVAAGLAQTR